MPNTEVHLHFTIVQLQMQRQSVSMTQHVLYFLKAGGSRIKSMTPSHVQSVITNTELHWRKPGQRQRQSASKTQLYFNSMQDWKPLILSFQKDKFVRLYLKRYAGAEQVRRIASLDVDGIKNALDCRLTPRRRLRRECIIIPDMCIIGKNSLHWNLAVT